MTKKKPILQTKTALVHNKADSSTNSQIIVHHYPKFMEWVFVRALSTTLHPAMVALCWLLLTAAYIAFYPTPTLDNDVWFHLAYGRHYVENLTFSIDHSQFSWTPANPDWKYGTWLGSTLLYLTHYLMGIRGLFFLQIASFWGTFYIFYRYLKALDVKPGVLHIFSFLMIVVCFKLTALYIKPEMFSTLFFATAAGIYFHACMNKERNFLWFYPPLFCLWVNTHGGFIVGLFFVSLTLTLEIFHKLFLRKTTMESVAFKSFFFSVILSYPAILINPQFFDYPWTIVKGLTQVTPALAGHYASVYAYQSLWPSLQFKLDSFNFVIAAWTLVFMAISYGALSFYSWFWKKYINLPALIINIIFFYLSMKMARAVMFFPVVWFFSFFFMLWKTSSIPANNRLSILALPAYLLLWMLIVYVGICCEPVRGRLWFGFDEYLPITETAYIMKHKLPAPVFNDYVIGGYMMWAMYPDYKVFIDPRWGPYQGFDSQKDWDSIGNYSSKEGLARFCEKYPFRVALIHNIYYNIILWFMRSGDWRIAFFDKTGAVLIHKSVIPLLSEDALDTDVSPSRFYNLHEPLILSNLFNFYNMVNPKFGREIRDLYSRNVTEFFKYKNSQLQSMDQAIHNAEQQLRVPQP